MKNETYIWDEVLDYVSEQITKGSFETWFKPSSLKIEEDKWYIALSNEFARDWVDMNYQSLIKDAIYETTNELPELKLIVEAQPVRSFHTGEKTDKLNNRNPSQYNESVRLDRLEKEIELIKGKLDKIMDTLERNSSQG
ncbi:DnaA N-terminal domain-containing protein [Virgibacillus natechei]